MTNELINNQSTDKMDIRNSVDAKIEDLRLYLTGINDLVLGYAHGFINVTDDTFHTIDKLLGVTLKEIEEVKEYMLKL